MPLPWRQQQLQTYGPHVWHALCHFWRLSTEQQCLLWKALKQSETPAVADWRLRLLLYDESKVYKHQAREVIHHLASPRIVIDAIEWLYDESLLSRQTASTLQDCILQATDKFGNWTDYKHTEISKS
jgi:hypothetical protein